MRNRRPRPARALAAVLGLVVGVLLVALYVRGTRRDVASARGAAPDVHASRGPGLSRAGALGHQLKAAAPASTSAGPAAEAEPAPEDLDAHIVGRLLPTSEGSQAAAENLSVVLGSVRPRGAPDFDPPGWRGRFALGLGRSDLDALESTWRWSAPAAFEITLDEAVARAHAGQRAVLLLRSAEGGVLRRVARIRVPGPAERLDVGDVSPTVPAEIFGRVLAAEAGPLAGARIRLRTGGPLSWVEGDGVGGTDADAESAEDGRFSLQVDALPASLLVTAPGHLPAYLPLVRAAGERTDVGDVVLHRGAAVTGRVLVRPAGFTPQALHLEGGGFGRQALLRRRPLQIDEHGRFAVSDLDPGSYSVAVVPGAAQPRVVTVPFRVEAEDTDCGTVVVDFGTGVRFVDPSGKLAEGGVVEATARGMSDVGAVTISERLTIGADHSMAWLGLVPEATWSFELTLPPELGGEIVFLRDVALNPTGIVELTVAPRCASATRVRLIDGRGSTPVALRKALVRSSVSLAGGSGGQGVTDARGWIRVPCGPDGWVRLEVAHPDHADMLVWEGQPSALAGGTIVFRAPVRDAHLRVVDAQGKPLPDTELQLVSRFEPEVHGPSQVTRYAWTDVQGRCTFRDLPTDRTYRLGLLMGGVSAMGNGFVALHEAWKPDPEGQDETTITMGGWQVHGTAAAPSGPVRAVRLQMMGVDEAGNLAMAGVTPFTTDQIGRFQVPGVQPGTYVLREVRGNGRDGRTSEPFDIREGMPALVVRFAEH